jgi:hypothetical protein
MELIRITIITVHGIFLKLNDETPDPCKNPITHLHLSKEKGTVPVPVF